MGERVLEPGKIVSLPVADGKPSTPEVFAQTQFQDGPEKEAGVNGCHHEDLLAILVDRFKGFQSGPFACEANKQVLGYLRGALRVLNERTKERQERGVEGKNVV